MILEKFTAVAKRRVLANPRSCGTNTHPNKYLEAPYQCEHVYKWHSRVSSWWQWGPTLPTHTVGGGSLATAESIREGVPDGRHGASSIFSGCVVGPHGHWLTNPLCMVWFSGQFRPKSSPKPAEISPKIDPQMPPIKFETAARGTPPPVWRFHTLAWVCPGTVGPRVGQNSACGRVWRPQTAQIGPYPRNTPKSA